MPFELGKKKKKEESDSEEEEDDDEKEQNSDEESEKGSDDDSDKKSDEDEDEDKDDEDEEDDDDDEDKDEDEDEDEDEDKSDKSDNSDDEEDEDKSDEDEDDSDDSGKKKKKKKGKEAKKDDKDKKGKKDDKNAKKGGKEDSKPTVEIKPVEEKPITISSIGQDLDDLTSHLGRIFPSYKFGPETKSPIRDPSPVNRYAPEPRYQEDPRYAARPQAREPEKNYKMSSSLPVPGYGHKAEPEKVLRDEKGIQYETAQFDRKQASPEAMRAVQEYKQRKEHDKQRKNMQDRSNSPIQFKAEPERQQQQQQGGRDRDRERDRRHEEQAQEGRRSTGKYSKEEYEKTLKEEKKRTQGNQGYQGYQGYQQNDNARRSNYSPNRYEPAWGGPYQNVDDFHASLSKKTANETQSIKRSMQDYYKNKPKGAMYVEQDTRPVERYTEKDFYKRSPSPNDRYEKYEQQNMRYGGYSSQKPSVIDANRKQINDAMNILMRKGQTEHKKI